jgi:hypothetical protein
VFPLLESTTPKTLVAETPARDRGLKSGDEIAASTSSFGLRRLAAASHLSEAAASPQALGRYGAVSKHGSELIANKMRRLATALDSTAHGLLEHAVMHRA